MSFNYSQADREDIQGGKVLESIIVLSSEGDVVKQANFTFDYFESSGYAAETMCALPNRLKRLKLNSLSFTDPLGVETPNTYSFKYNETSLPDKFSNAQDYWGYYNGNNLNASLIPKLFYENNGFSLTVPGSNRAVSETSSKACILQEIHHPTGAVEEFTYENNLVSPGMDLFAHVNFLPNPLSPKAAHLYQSDAFLNDTLSTGSYDIYDTLFVINENSRGSVKFMLCGCDDFHSTNCE